VQDYWEKEIKALEKRVTAATSDQEQMELSRKLKWMQDTEMCVVISQEQNEIQTFKKWDMNIIPHRTKMEKRELDKEFKDPDSNFRVVFVCAMWLTGFDVKTLSCLYLDKPLKAHTLMQTIARANRVAAGKSNGLIIDYIGIVGALKKALNDYTQNKNGQNRIDPTVDKEELIKQIVRAAADAKQLLVEHNFDLDSLIKAEKFKKMSLLKDGAEAMCSDPETKKSFDTYANEIGRLIKYLDRNDVNQDIRDQADAIQAIFREMQKKRKHIDTTDLMVEINHIINENVEIEEQKEGLVESRQFDISKIDFDLLAAEFAKIKHKNLLLKDLNDLVQERLAKMMSVNPSRIDYYVRYMSIIEDYNAEQDRTTIEKTFMELMNLAQSMSDEQQRYVREGFANDEELSIYDLLFSDNLSKNDIAKIKKMSVDLLQKIKERIAGMDHWTDKQETRAAVDILIRDILYEEIPDSMFDKLDTYRKAIYEHVYTHYKQVAA
jgi:type I restriction enzyme R subunit